MDSITASEMLDEFRLMEGTLFQDEEAKIFYDKSSISGGLIPLIVFITPYFFIFKS